MDNLITLSCPSCGANLEVASGTQQISCEYCGNTHILIETLTDESSSKALHKRNLAQGKLMDFFDFNTVDLEYNRRGKISPYQERRFFVEGFTSFMLLLAIGLIAALGIMIRAPFNEPCGCSSIGVISLMIVGLINYKLVTRPVEAGVVQSEIGSLGKPPRATLKPIFYIGRESFSAKGNPFTVLEWNVPYKIYYTPMRRTILSIEILNS